MDSYQLRYALLETLPMYTAVCAKDQLVDIKKKSFAVICNNQKSTESGMHWTGFFKTDGSNVVEFFDSFAMPLEFYGSEFVEFCSKFSGKVRISTNQFQSNESDYCGNYCLYFLIQRSRCKTFDNVISKFSTINFLQNDQIVKEFVNTHFKFPHFSDCKRLCRLRCAQSGFDLSSVCVQRNGRCFKYNKAIHRC